MKDDKIVSLEDARKKAKSKPLSKRDAQTLINKLAKNSALVFIPEGEHAEGQGDLRDFTRDEVIEILLEGIIREEPRYLGDGWAYKLEYPRFRRHPFGAAAVAMIREKKEGDKILLVVTVMWLDKR